MAHQTGGHGIHQTLVDLDIGVLPRHLERHTPEEPTGSAQRIRLVHDGDPTTTTLRELERSVRDALDAPPCEHPYAQGSVLIRHHLGVALEHVHLGVETLEVLAHDHKVNVPHEGLNPRQVP